MMTFMIYALIWERYGFSYQGAATAIYILVFGYIAILDLYTQSIPNYLSFPAIAIGLSLGAFWPGSDLVEAATGALTGFGVMLFIWVAPRMSIGAGDVKLAAGIGAINGFPLILFGLLTAFFCVGITAIIILSARVLRRSDNMAFAPFLVLGGLAALLWGDSISTWYLDRLG